MSYFQVSYCIHRASSVRQQKRLFRHFYHSLLHSHHQVVVAQQTSVQIQRIVALHVLKVDVIITIERVMKIKHVKLLLSEKTATTRLLLLLLSMTTK